MPEYQLSKMTRKQERRKARHERNVLKDQTHKKEAWEAGKLIKPNHNNKAYPPEYSTELGKRLVDRIRAHKEAATTNEEFIGKFRLYRKKCIEYILHYDHSQGLSAEYIKIKQLLETYWDDTDNLINIDL